MNKWKILTLSAKWDRIRAPIYEASAKGRRIPILKTLLTNACPYQCKYCAFRRGRRAERRTWDVNELVNVTLTLWRKGAIKGIFLSSGILKDPETTVEKQIEVAEGLRRRGFKGYIHLRLMPGTPKDLIWRAAVIADRIGVNLETVSKDYFSEIAPDKGDFKVDVVKRMEWISRAYRMVRQQRERLHQKIGYLSAGIDTQIMVGVVGEKDLEHLRVTFELYRDMELRRVYYSPFEPIPETPFETKHPCPMARVLRLYQTSYLIRDYEFTLKDMEFIVNDNGMLPLDKDPKRIYAERNKDLYPINLNEAKYRELLKIPGIGPTLARKIIRIRNEKSRVKVEDLGRILGKKTLHEILKYVEI